MLDTHRLRVLRAVVASGSIQAAANNLGYTPSAVSQQVSALQKETGLTLITRVGRGIEPTSAGRELAHLAESVLGRLSEVEARVRDLREGRSGALSIAYFSSVGIAWMPRVVRVLTERFPVLRLQLTLDESLDHAEEQRWDLRLTPGPAPDGTAQQSACRHQLLVEPYRVVLPPDHPLAGDAVVDLGSLAGVPMIDNDVSNGWCARNVAAACAAAGFVPQYAVQAQDHQTALAFVQAGLGVTVLPNLCTFSLPEGLVVRSLANPTPMRSISAQVHDAVLDTPPIGLALRTLRECAAENTGTVA